MCWIKNLILVLALIALIDSCIKQPEYSVVPKIKSLDFSFKRPTDPGGDDSLIFTITFQDGDGDLGINSGETSINSTDIVSPFYYVYDTIRKQFVTNAYSDSSNVKILKEYNSRNGTAYAFVNYRAIREQLVQQADTFPTLNCINWQGPSPINEDTLYVTNNMNAYNFIVGAYLKNTDGTYTAYFTPGGIEGFPSCILPLQGINGAFPVLSSDLGKSSPIDGTLSYNATYADAGFYLPVKGKTIRFDIYITDRAFHKSNVMSVEHTF